MWCAPGHLAHRAHLEPAARTHSRASSQALAVWGGNYGEHTHSVGNSYILHMVGPAVRLLVGELAVIVLGVAAMLALSLLDVHLDTALDIVERLAPREVDQVAMVRHLLHRAREGKQPQQPRHRLGMAQIGLGALQAQRRVGKGERVDGDVAPRDSVFLTLSRCVAVGGEGEGIEGGVAVA